MMLRARPQFDGALAMVAIFHAFVADALARTICALPFVSFDIAVVSVAQFALLTNRQVASARPVITATACR